MLFQRIFVHLKFLLISCIFLNFQPSQDLSPIYEEIHGGSRSTVSTTSSGSSSGAHHGALNATARAALASLKAARLAEVEGKFHYSEYAFTAIDSTMLSVSRGQVVRVLHATEGEWWYVEDRNSNRGYVPHTFLKIYPASGVTLNPTPTPNAEEAPKTPAATNPDVSPVSSGPTSLSVTAEVHEESGTEDHTESKSVEENSVRSNK